jgi:hypothetical protein
MPERTKLLIAAEKYLLLPDTELFNTIDPKQKFRNFPLTSGKYCKQSFLGRALVGDFRSNPVIQDVY